MKFLLPFACLLFLVSCVETKEEFKTHKKDYASFLKVTPADTSSKYFELWNSKIKADSMQLLSFGIVSGEYTRFFKNTGNISYLKKSEQALEKAVQIAAIGRAGYYRALARNYISQHRFQEALEMAKSAQKIGTGQTETHSLLFDVHMELGNYETAKEYLDRISNFSNFGFLIRLAKWNDHRGDLDQTIRMMEKATLIAKSSKNKELLLWSYTNLADYYGHAGDIQKSYEHYLKSLQLDPQNAYAKKGIAWILFSHENNPKEALRIMNTVTAFNASPDYFLLKSEMADYANLTLDYRKNMDHFLQKASNKDYGAMYRPHLIRLHLETTGKFHKAIAMALKEVNNRPTPESYALLAYSHFKNGDTELALDLVKKHIYGQTFEPNILLQVAEIFKASGAEKEVQLLKEELSGATYELGPKAALKMQSL